MNLALKNTGCKQECQRTITTANKTTINVNTLRYKETELHNKTLKKKKKSVQDHDSWTVLSFATSQLGLELQFIFISASSVNYSASFRSYKTIKQTLCVYEKLHVKLKVNLTSGI